MKKIYIAGPYTKGDIGKNLNKVIKVADYLLKIGYIPYIPHLTHFWHIISPKPYETWLKYDNEFLKECDIVLRLEGESAGADKEVELAKKLKIPVFYHKGKFKGSFFRKVKTK